MTAPIVQQADSFETLQRLAHDAWIVGNPAAVLELHGAAVDVAFDIFETSPDIVSDVSEVTSAMVRSELPGRSVTVSAGRTFPVVLSKNQSRRSLSNPKMAFSGTLKTSIPNLDKNYPLGGGTRPHAEVHEGMIQAVLDEATLADESKRIEIMRQLRGFSLGLLGITTGKSQYGAFRF